MKQNIVLKTNSKVYWRVHTPSLMKEILNNQSTQILEIPLKIFSNILAEVGDRAAELNDPKLNALMCRLTIYSVSDPENKDFNQKILDQTLAKGGFK